MPPPDFFFHGKLPSNPSLTPIIKPPLHPVLRPDLPDRLKLTPIAPSHPLASSGILSEARLNDILHRALPEGTAPTSEPTLTQVSLAPIAALDPDAPAWTKNIAIGKTVVVKDPWGIDLQIGQIFFRKSVTIQVAGAGGGAPTFLAKVPIVKRLITGGKPFVDSGTVWIAARLLDPAAGNDAFIGLRVTGGAINVSATVTATDDVWTLAPNWSLDLTLNLEQPPAAAPTAGPGADLAAAQVGPPPHASFSLDFSGKRNVSFDAKTVQAFGATFTLARNNDAPFFHPATAAVIVPATRPPTLNLTQHLSPLWSIEGASPIGNAGWALIVTRTTIAGLAEAAGSGAWWVELTKPMRARWPALPADAPMNGVRLLLSPQGLLVSATVELRTFAATYSLWNDKNGRPSELEFHTVASSLVMLGSFPGLDGVTIVGEAAYRLDRPLRANGEPVAIQKTGGTLILSQDAKARRIVAWTIRPADDKAPNLSFALVNGLVVCRPATGLITAGILDGLRIQEGVTQIYHPFAGLTPTLPDPYVANRTWALGVPNGQLPALLTNVVAWKTPDSPQGTLALPNLSPQFIDPFGDGEERFRTRPPLLIDVSSAADQFGLYIGTTEDKLTVDNLVIGSSARSVAVVTLPPISWEPVLSEPHKLGEQPIIRAPNDGGLAGLRVDALDRIPWTPAPLLQRIEKAVQSKAEKWSGTLPLPFGLVAQLNGPGATANARLQTDTPKFPGDLASNEQFTLFASKTANPDDPDPLLPGSLAVIDKGEQKYGTGILTDPVAGKAKEVPGVPISRYDLSGYGATLFSRWRDPKAFGPKLVKAHFDVLVGRTAHEVVQIQGYLCPWYAKVVRTITFDRQPGGWVLRKDTGWQPVTDGKFKYHEVADPKYDAYAHPFSKDDHRIHRGAIEGVENIRNIEIVGAIFPAGWESGSGPAWQPVTFDADVVFSSSGPPLEFESGAKNRRTPTSHATGWILVHNHAPDTLPVPASADQLRTLTKAVGPAVAPINCGLRLGKSASNPGVAFRATQVTARVTDDAEPALVAAVHGIPTLPKQGAWSVAKKLGATQAPAELPREQPIPLIRPNIAGPSGAVWHFAEPNEVRQLEAAMTSTTAYGFVQSLGTQKVFYPHPKVSNAPKPLSLPGDAHLADVSALLGCASVFPGLEKALNLKTLKNLATEGAGPLIDVTEELNVPDPVELVTLGAGLRVLVAYKGEDKANSKVRILANPSVSPRWSLAISRICFIVELNGGALISIFASVSVRENETPHVSDLNLHYGDKLKPLQSIFTTVQQVARFLPGGKDAGLKIAFEGNRLSVINAFALPTIPLGAGQIKDVTAEMGFDFNLSPFDIRFAASLGSQRHPFTWVVSPLAGTGMVGIGVSSKGLDVIVQVGLGVGLCIDVGIASGSASVALAIELNTQQDPWLLSVILSGQASVEVLQGLVGATITLATGFGISRPVGLPSFEDVVAIPKKIPSISVDLAASVSVGIHVSVCWVVDVDWDGYWQFRQTLKTPEIDVP